MSYFDDNEDWIVYGRGRNFSAPREVTCKHCGRADLYWQKVHNRKTDYQLTNPDGVPHNCVKPASVDDFDVVE